MTFTDLYYIIKPLVPRPLQILLRRKIVRRKRKIFNHVWPIAPDAAEQPDGWLGWPEKKRFALVLQHDVDYFRGHERCYQLMELEESLGLRSSFNFVPERYNVSKTLRNDLADKGFEVGVHGLKHDGRLFASKRIFQKRAIRINHYLREWESVGFRSPSMHHNLDWLQELNIVYDASTFDTDPFEPQPDGTGTIFPFWMQANSNRSGYLELPYTLPQDFTLFVLLREKNIHIWKQKLDWIASCGGMALLNTHPDYMNFNGKNLRLDEYPAEYYVEFLDYIKSKYRGQYWHALPKEVARFWVSNMVRHSS